MTSYKDMLLLDAVDAYLFWKSQQIKSSSALSYRRMLSHFCIGLQNKKLGEVYWLDITNYLDMLRQAGYKQNTLIPIVVAIRNLFTFFNKQDSSILNPEMIPIPHKEYNLPRVLDGDLYKELMEGIPRNNDARHVRNLAIIKLLYDTGARSGEVASLDLVDISYRKAIIRTEKNRGTRPFREIYWSEDTQKTLDRWLLKKASLKDRDSKKYSGPELFCSVTGGKSGERLTIKGIGEMLRKYAQRLNLPIVINPHSFRHKVGRDIIKNGGSAVDVMNILGHATLASSTIYTQMYGLEAEERYRTVLKR